MIRDKIRQLKDTLSFYKEFAKAALEKEKLRGKNGQSSQDGPEHQDTTEEEV